jgi:ligand-binding SRPBCC domain-containing protein
MYMLEREQSLDIPLERAFAFFADAANLATVTPPWLRFNVLTPSPIEMQPGTLIDYRLRVRGIPLRWRTQIVTWEPPHRFVDVQLQGPYARWEHTHSFQADGREAVVITDRVVYGLPLGLLGSLAHSMFVRRDLEQLFDYRRDAIAAQLELRPRP